MTQEEFQTKLTVHQQTAMRQLQERSGVEWDAFLAAAIPPSGGVIQDYVAIPDFHGMYVGIEADGYTHT